MSDTTYTVNPVGRVVVEDEGFSIVIDAPYREALVGLDGFSHLYILFWCHFVDSPEAREVVTEFVDDEVVAESGAGSRRRVQAVDASPAVLPLVDEDQNEVVGRRGGHIAPGALHGMVAL